MFSERLPKKFDWVKLAQLIRGKQGVLTCFACVFPLTERFSTL